VTRTTGFGLAAACVVVAAVAPLLMSGLTHLDSRAVVDLTSYSDRHPAVLRSWSLVTTVGAPRSWQISGAMGALVLIVRRRYLLAGYICAGLLGASVLSTVVKLLVRRPRPLVEPVIAHAAGWSFPSGHAMTSFVGICLLHVTVRPHLNRCGRAVLLTLSIPAAVAIGLSRIALGVHYPSDVLAGWFIGCAWMLILNNLFGSRMQRRQRRRPRSGRPPAV
jgi:membrane-associated phospholipid phosphatase